MLWEPSFANVNFMRTEHSECELYASWALQMWFFESRALQMWIFRELSIANVNFMKAEHLECEFYESCSLWMWISWGLSFVNANFLNKSWALRMRTLWKLSFVNVNWEMSIANVNFMKAEHCTCEFIESWALHMQFYESRALQMWILWELSIANVNFMITELSWALRM